MIQLSLVIPFYNEERNVDALCQRLFPAAAATGVPFEVVCVDDGSRDRTVELLRAQQKTHPELVLVRFARNHGQHAAVTAGFATARGDWIITLDADLQNPPEEIINLVERFRAGHDLINTVRRDRQDSWFRRWASRQTNVLVRHISGIRLNDFGCMLRGYAREVAQAVVACREYQTFIPALATLFARNPIEIEVAHAARAAGVSSYPLTKLFALQLDLITSFSVWPLKQLFRLGVILAVLGVVIGGVLLGGRLHYGDHWAGQGTLTVLGILCVFMGMQMFALGLLGEYVGRIFQQVRLREPFIVNAIERHGQPVEFPPVKAGG